MTISEKKPPLDMGPWLNDKMKECNPEEDFIGMVDDCYDQKADTSALLPRGKMAVVWAYNTIARLEEEIGRMREAKDSAYTERNSVVAFLSSIYPSHLCVHDPNDTDLEDEWRTIVCIHSPCGQLTWHLHDNHVPLFDHLEMDHSHWDGHSTEEKYRRLAELRRASGK